jgi:hypothetical protein
VTTGLILLSLGAAVLYAAYRMRVTAYARVHDRAADAWGRRQYTTATRIISAGRTGGQAAADAALSILGGLLVGTGIAFVIVQ